MEKNKKERGLVEMVKLKEVYKSSNPKIVKREIKRKNKKKPKILLDKILINVVL